MSSFSFDSLLDDLVLIVFSYLKLSQLVKLRLLSRRYLNLIDRFYYCRNYSYYIHSHEDEIITIGINHGLCDEHNSFIVITHCNDSRRTEYKYIIDIIKIFDRNTNNYGVDNNVLSFFDHFLINDRYLYHNEFNEYEVKRIGYNCCGIESLFNKDISDDDEFYENPSYYISLKNNKIGVLKFLYFIRDLIIYIDIYEFNSIIDKYD